MKNREMILQEKGTILANLSKSIKENNADAVAESFEALCNNIEENVLAQAREEMESSDNNVLAQRGNRVLTSVEKKYYDKVINAMNSVNPKDALTKIDVTFPETIIDAVFEDLAEQHPLLDAVDFVSATGLTKYLTSTSDNDKATWGALTSKIITEITAGFKEVDAGQYKLSAFLPISNDMLSLGASYLDRYIRQVLTEAYAMGLEDGIVTGNGKDAPIGMIRSVADNVSVTAGVYPEKTPIAVSDFTPKTVGDLASKIAKNSHTQKTRKLENLVLIVNPVDYYTKVMPATTIMAPDGTYRSDVMPIPMNIIQSSAVEEGKAVFGLGKRYLMLAGFSTKTGAIEYSDEYQFLEDNRVYKIKGLANGLPKDDNAFLLLNISDLKPAVLEVEVKSTTEAKG